jgi:hypothetical protein
MVFAIRIKHPLDVTVQGSHDADPRKHRWPMSPWPPSAAPWCRQTFAAPSYPDHRGRRPATPRGPGELGRPIASVNRDFVTPFLILLGGKEAANCSGLFRHYGANATGAEK